MRPEGERKKENPCNTHLYTRITVSYVISDYSFSFDTIIVRLKFPLGVWTSKGFRNPKESGHSPSLSTPQKKKLKIKIVSSRWYSLKRPSTTQLLIE